MTFHGRSLDDMPLAAYGGSGMDLTEDDDSRIEAATAATPAPADPVEVPDPVAPGPFAHAVPAGALPDDNFGVGRPPASRPLPPVVRKVITTLRTSRVAAGSAFVGVILVGLLLLNGGAGKPGAAGAQSSATPAPVVSVTAEPGNATLVVTGKSEQSWTFGAMTGTGAAGAPLSATWADATTNTLGLEGTVDRGTRKTDASLVLSFTVTLDGVPVTFTSTDGECTIGMAVHTRNISGSFSCKKLKSDDGKLTIRASGTYRT